MNRLEKIFHRPGEGCLSELSAELYLNGDLSGERKTVVEGHLGVCPRCKTMLEGMEKAAGGWRPDVGLIRERAGSKTFSVWLRGLLDKPAVLVPVAALAAVLVAVPFVIRERDSTETVRFKGGVGMRFFVKSDGGSKPGVSGETLKPGDAIKFAVNPGGHRHVMVVNMEDGGDLALYYPREGEGGISETDRETVLPASVTLDGFVGYERVFAVFSDSPLKFEDVSAAAARLPRTAGKIDLSSVEALPLAHPQASFLIRKE